MEVLGCVCQQECLHNSAIAQNFQISLQFMPAARSLRHIFVPVYVIQHKCKQAPQKTSSVKASLVQNSLRISVCKPANCITCFHATHATSQPIIQSRSINGFGSYATYNASKVRTPQRMRNLEAR